MEDIIQLKVGDSCYLREDYDTNNRSDKFTIPCKIVGFGATEVYDKVRALKRSAGTNVIIKREDRTEEELVTKNSIRKA